MSYFVRKGQEKEKKKVQNKKPIPVIVLMCDNTLFFAH